MSIGERISALRKEHDISQGQLADMLDISRQAVSKWENDQASPDTLKLIKLAEILDTEVEYLATGRKPVYEKPIVVNLVNNQEKVVEKVVEKPVYREKRVVRVQYRRNPVEYIAVAIVCFLLGIAAALLFYAI